MKFFVCHITSYNETLIPYTDQYIIEATQHFFPDSADCFMVEEKDQWREHMRKMVETYRQGIPMMTLDTVGKMVFPSTPVPLEKNRLTYYSDAPYGTFAPIVDSNPAGNTVTYSDRSFRHYYEDIKSPLNYYFMPHGGPNNILCDRPMADRDHKISFIGRIMNPTPAGSFESLLAGSDPKLVSIFKEASQEALEEGKDIYLAYRENCLKLGLNPLEIVSKKLLSEILSALISWVRNNRRNMLLREFKNSPIDIFGPVKGDVRGVSDQNHRFHGALKGAEVLEVMQNTRILLNSLGVFNEGSHERIWFGLASGCMPYTDPSNYVLETFEDDKSLLFIDYENLTEDVKRIEDYANSPNKLQPIIDAARPIYLENHTWIKRLQSTFAQMGIL